MQHDGRSRFVAIPRGSVMLVLGMPQLRGLVDIEYDGQRLAVFSRDIEERAHKLRPGKARGSS